MKSEKAGIGTRTAAIAITAILLVGSVIAIYATMRAGHPIMSSHTTEASPNSILATSGTRNSGSDSFSSQSSPSLSSLSANSVTLNLIKMIRLGSATNGPGMAYDAFHGYLYVENGTNQISITVFDTSNDSIIANIRDTNASGGLLYDPWNHDVYASQFCTSASTIASLSNYNRYANQLGMGNTLLVLQGKHISKDIYGPCANGQLAYDPSDHKIFETANSEDNPVVNVINDTDNSIMTPIKAIGTFDGPTGSIAYDSASKLVYVGAGPDVLVVSPETDSVTTSISIESTSGPVINFVGPIAYNPMNGLVYVSNSLDHGITEVNGTAVIGNFTQPNYGFAGYSADLTRGISFISAYPGIVIAGGLNNTYLLNVTLTGAKQIAYDPTNHHLYVDIQILQGVNEYSGVAVFSTTRTP